MFCKKIFIVIFIIFCFFSEVSAGDMMWAFYYPTTMVNKKADHVYTLVNNNGSIESYVFHGGKNGGEYLSDTYGEGDYSKLRCVYNNRYICQVNYGLDGVCHQDANMFLYSSGKKVTKAKGYWLFYALFGHYGSQYWWWQCRRNCDM